MEQLSAWHLSLENIAVKSVGHYHLDHISLHMQSPQLWAITGESGSGKTLLAKCIAGLAFHRGVVDMSGHLKKNIQYISQEHRFTNRSNVSDFYYQQRYNSQDAEDSLTVAEYLGQGANQHHPAMKWLRLENMLDKNLIQLSNGENKRLQLALALQQEPGLLIADSPYTGLDTGSRCQLDDLFLALPASGVALLLIVPSDHIPAFVTHLAVLQAGSLQYAGPKAGAKVNEVAKGLPPVHFPLREKKQVAVHPPPVYLEQVSIRYGNKIILEHINWEVKAGECWALTGPNGSGKSTLLSLITGDNPQAYANDVRLFGKRRGSGESIWDIKRQIGFVSPELHLYFDSSFNVYEVVASGLFDTIGLFRQLSDTDRQKAEDMMKLTDISHLRQKYLHQLSRGEQRLALLARALVKLPPLLVLDEPCQGLDEKQSAHIRHLINELCRQTATTLIYVSHYAEDFPACITRQLSLENGKVVYNGLLSAAPG